MGSSVEVLFAHLQLSSEANSSDYSSGVLPRSCSLMKSPRVCPQKLWVADGVTQTSDSNVVEVITIPKIATNGQYEWLSIRILDDVFPSLRNADDFIPKKWDQSRQSPPGGSRRGRGWTVHGSSGKYMEIRQEADLLNICFRNVLCFLWCLVFSCIFHIFSNNIQ